MFNRNSIFKNKTIKRLKLIQISIFYIKYEKVKNVATRIISTIKIFIEIYKLVNSFSVYFHYNLVTSLIKTNNMYLYSLLL